MGCTEALIAVGMVCALLALMVVCTFWGSTPTKPGFFKDWKAVRVALRSARTGLEKRLVCVLAVAQALRGSLWGVIAATAGGGFPVAGALCTDTPGIIRAVCEGLKDIYDHIHSSRVPSR
jgi:hypothetical protein